ncbi:MAG: DUF488 domain-containing protein [Chloroflexi bacterium]|nr:DUF488 domain-containing protein [Chloroflexota bacterium]
MERLLTIGAHGFDAESFFSALQRAEVDLFMDLRRRRGMRGRAYSFANASRLQQELAARGIAYRHVISLAPEPATRELQDRDDAANRTPKRRRASLGEAFVADYTRRTLEPFDWAILAEELKGIRRPALFCVERVPEACHRRLVAERLAGITGVLVTDLLP